MIPESVIIFVLSSIPFLFFALLAWGPGWFLPRPAHGAKFPSKRGGAALALWLVVASLGVWMTIHSGPYAAGAFGLYWYFLLPPAVAGIVGRRPFFHGSIVVLIHNVLIISGLLLFAREEMQPHSASDPAIIPTLLFFMCWSWGGAMLVCAPLWLMWKRRQPHAFQEKPHNLNGVSGAD